MLLVPGGWAGAWLDWLLMMMMMVMAFFLHGKDEKMGWVALLERVGCRV